MNPSATTSEAPSAITTEPSEAILLESGQDALSVRIEWIRRARHSLDLQYYIWDEDTSGCWILLELLAAAERGVTIRLLIDDLRLLGLEERLLPIQQHPNIQIRSFNPFRTPGRLKLLRAALDIVTGAQRLHRRMHNKLFNADQQAIIIGGRNLSDRYFDRAADFNFRDLDVLLMGGVGPVVTQLFDAYWQSQWAIPIEELRSKDGLQDVAQVHQQLRDEVARYVSLDSPVNLSSQPLKHKCYVEVVADPPGKISGGKMARSKVRERMNQLLDQAKETVMIENAYFIPGKDGVKRIDEITDRGVNISILTNSLASNDSGPVYSRYQHYRKGVLSAGALLAEFNPFANQSAGRINLHSKAATFDNHASFVGSFNMDPRSRYSNTEMGVVIYSETFNQALQQSMRHALTRHGWRLRLTKHHQIRWDDEHQSTVSPRTSIGRRMLNWCCSWLPIEPLL